MPVARISNGLEEDNYRWKAENLFDLR